MAKRPKAIPPEDTTVVEDTPVKTVVSTKAELEIILTQSVTQIDQLAHYIIRLREHISKM